MIARSKVCYGGGTAMGVEAKATRGGRKWNGVNPAPSHLIYRGSTDLPVAVPSAVQHASTALSREVREKIKADFSLTNHSYGLNSEFRSSTEKEYNIRSS
jgi:hypothetical protein